MRKKLERTAFTIAVTLAAVFAVRWTIRAAVTRAYRAERDVRPVRMPLVPALRVHSLAALVPKALHVNIAGLAVSRRAERLGMPYSLAVDLAEDKATASGWERIDDENALTIRNLSGMERVYRTPEGAIVLRELRAIHGNDTLMEDFEVPAQLVPAPDEQTTPDTLARRSAQRVKELMPAVIRGVVAGSPMMTELIERGGGAAFLVHCVADAPAGDVREWIAKAALAAGWRPWDNGEGQGVHYTLANLTMYHEVVERPNGNGCDVNYRFTDDEVYIPTKGKTDENR